MHRPLVNSGNLLLVAALLVGLDQVQGSEPRATIPDDLVLKRFSVAKGGDSLLIPVRVGEKDHLFVIDTGSNITLFDDSLNLAGSRRPAMVTTGRGVIELKTFDPPAASVGPLPFSVVGPVMSMDLKKIREVNGDFIEGILGMDFLGQYVVRVDFDRGQVHFLKSAPKDAGDVVPLDWEPGEVPKVVGFLTGGERIRFSIDTGLASFGSGSLQTQVVQGLAAKRRLRKIGSSLSETLSGTLSSSDFQGDLLALGGFSVNEPVFAENPIHNLLGLGFWSRFTVTFDFPGRKLFLRKAERYGHLDRWDRSGLHLLRKGNAVVVAQVVEGSAGVKAGVREGDVLRQMGNLRADEASLFELRALLCKVGRTECVVRCGLEDHRLTIHTAR